MKRKTSIESRAKGPSHPLVSLVIVTYNSMADLPSLFESIRRSTDDPWEAIVVDNASRDGTREFLAGAADDTPGAAVRVILNDTNRGFTGASNQGIRAARGEYIVLLNPDTLVTSGWSSRMRSHFTEGVGAVGPVSNYVAGLQKMTLYLRRQLPAEITFEALATIMAEDNAGVPQETKLLIGFCVMIPRSVIRRVGLLDEDLFLGNDDLEYSWRLRREGFRLLVATDTFIYHKGQQSFQSDAASVTSRLVRESTDCLQRKLEIAFGAGSVPAPETLWGMSWFRPSSYRHGVLPPAIATRVKSLANAGNTFLPIALYLDDEPASVFVLGPGDGILRGIPARQVAMADPDCIYPHEISALRQAISPGSIDVALVLGTFPGLDDDGAGNLLDELEALARSGVILVLPAGPLAQAEMRGRLRGTGPGSVIPPCPASWERHALLDRGYDLLALPDMWGFGGDLSIAARWQDGQARERTRQLLRAYYHPSLLELAANTACAGTPSADPRAPLFVTAPCSFGAPATAPAGAAA